ncbi:MAG: EAL domain-containing protein [Nitrosomonas sp.]|nr:EAL domain-containing protein [Nitrosomonas sp.]MDP1951273.1 EAL domain-containing protein [Nitrosomonas sp.]
MRIILRAFSDISDKYTQVICRIIIQLKLMVYKKMDMPVKCNNSSLLMSLILEIYNSMLLKYASDEDLLRTVCNKLLLHETYLIVWIGDIQPDRSSSKIVAAEGAMTSLLHTYWNGLSVKDNLITQCMHEKTPIQYIEKTTSEAGGDVWRDFMVRIKASAIIAVPLMIDNQCTGALYIGTELPDASFNSMESCLLTLLGQYISYILDARASSRKLSQSLKEIRITEKIFNSTHEGIVVTDPQGAITAINPAITQITGYSEQELIGENPRILQSGKQSKAFYIALWKKLKQTGHWKGEVWNRHKDGTIYPEILNISAIKTTDTEQESIGYVAILTDISTQKAMETQLQQMAFYDSLTSLPNRALFKELFNSAVASAKRNRQSIAILYIDLDGFKIINDTMGHSAGDELLQVVARKIGLNIRENDVLARLGGDEFALILQPINSIEDPTTAAGKINRLLEEPILIGAREVFISASIGISLYPENGNTYEDLLMNADTAMYRAKEQGKKCSRLYTASMSHYLSTQLALETELRFALQRNELVLHYQPQLDLNSGQVIGVEALVRWQHPRHGLIAPDQFIPLAEQSDLIISLGEWILHEACATMKHWQDTSIPVERIAVNFSTQQISNPNLIHHIKSTLAETGLKAEALEIEITESCLMPFSLNCSGSYDCVCRNTDAPLINANNVLDQLKKIGVRIAVDDFGTGYSNLGYLKAFPLDCLKIDKSFMLNVSTKKNDATIVKAIIAMGQALGLELIAEGIENIEQQQFLIENHVNLVQGYYYARPLPKEQFEIYMKKSTGNKQTLI